MNYSIIIPFFNEENNVIKLNDEINSTVKKLINDNREFEIIYIDDGSKDNTFKKLKETLKNNVKTTLVRHKINYSQSSAIFTGVSISKYENLIFLDGDGQNDPSNISEMIKIYENGYDMVSGWRKNRKDNFYSRNLPSKLANFIIRIFTKSKLHDHGCAIKVLKKDIIDYKISWGDFHRLLAARISFYNWRIKEIVVNHRPRLSGKSKYGINRVFRILIDLAYMHIFKFTGRPSIYFFGKFGLWCFFGSLISFVYMIYNKIYLNVDLDSTPLPILVVMLTIMGFLFLFMGLISQLLMNIGSNKDSDHIQEKIENLN